MGGAIILLLTRIASAYREGRSAGSTGIRATGIYFQGYKEITIGKSKTMIRNNVDSLKHNCFEPPE